MTLALENNLETNAHEFNRILESFSVGRSCSEASDYKFINGNLIHKLAVVNWDLLEIGVGNIIGPFVCIGTAAQHKYLPSNGKIKIGDFNTIRECSTVHLPTDPSIGTIIGNNNFIMASAHINHDCILEDNIIMCNNAALAGHVRVMNGAYLSLNSSVHQFQVIGSWSIIGMNSCVTRLLDVEPGFKYAGTPAKKMKINYLGLQRNRITETELELAKQNFWNYRKPSINLTNQTRDRGVVG